MVILNIMAICFSLFKIIASIVTKKIKDGILLIYISDIFLEYVKSLRIFIDVAYVSMLIYLAT